MYSLSIQTPHREFLARYTEEGLAELRFPSDDSIKIDPVPAVIRDWHSLTSAAVLAILSARVPNLLPPLDLSPHTDFQRGVWHQLRRISLGQTLSYLEVAQRLGNPRATRAVGGACGANPIPLIIPCHRVLGACRTLGGFSGGLDWKRKLLAIEGISIQPEKSSKSRQTELQPEFLFHPVSAEF